MNNSFQFGLLDDATYQYFMNDYQKLMMIVYGKTRVEVYPKVPDWTLGIRGNRTYGFHGKSCIPFMELKQGLQFIHLVAENY